MNVLDLNHKDAKDFFLKEESGGFNSEVRDYSRKIGGSPVISLPMGELKKLQIPIPHPDDPKKSLAEQARIVSILDKFDTLTHSITEGLPYEIELRQKQYEYYREKLLNFPQFPSPGGVAGEA